MNDKELREKTKHRTFTSMAQRRRWLALQNDVEKNEKKVNAKGPIAKFFSEDAVQELIKICIIPIDIRCRLASYRLYS